jgi:hypothetical protein
MHALELLYKQRNAAIRHMELLAMHRERALQDPMAFVAKLQAHVWSMMCEVCRYVDGS